MLNIFVEAKDHIDLNSVGLNQLLCNNAPKLLSKVVQNVHTKPKAWIISRPILVKIINGLT